MDVRNFFLKDFDTPQKFLLSERFKDKDGNQIYFEIKPLTYEDRLLVMSSCKDKNGILIPEKERLKLVCKSVISPNLSDASLQQFYSVLGEEKLISKMLLAFEFEKLADKVFEISGFDFNINTGVDHLKN